jgi:hypothetical protein
MRFIVGVLMFIVNWLQSESAQEALKVVGKELENFLDSSFPDMDTDQDGPATRNTEPGNGEGLYEHPAGETTWTRVS